MKPAFIVGWLCFIALLAGLILAIVSPICGHPEAIREVGSNCATASFLLGIIWLFVKANEDD